MARRKLHRWVLSWLHRWFPGRVQARRRPVVNSFKPQLMILEARWSPTSINATPPFEFVRPRFSPLQSDMSAVASEARKTSDWSESIPGEDLSLLSTPRPADEGSVLVRTPQQQEPAATSVSSPQDTSTLDTLFARLSSRPFSPLSTPPKPLPPPQANAGGSGGAGIGGRSTPNAGMGGGGPTGGGGGPGLINANQFLNVNNFGPDSPAPGTSATPTSAFSFQQAHFSPTSSGLTGSGVVAPMVTPTAGPQSPTASPQHPKPPVAHPHSGHDPLYVIDLNTGENIPANATLNSFSRWSENLLAQVSGATVSSYSWNTRQAPDLTNITGTTTNNLRGTWKSFTTGTSTDTISVTETPTSGSPLTLTFSFALDNITSPGYSSSRPTTK